MSTSTVQDAAAVDWDAAAAVAAGLGRRTLLLVAERDADATREWCLQMRTANTGEGNALRSMSYFELAVLTGHRTPAARTSGDRKWRELLEAVQQLAATVKTKADMEAKAAEEAAAAEKAAEEAAPTEAATDEAADDPGDNDEGEEAA